MEENQFLLSADLAWRIAAIDIGSNSIRLSIAEPLRDGAYRILDEEKETTRLSLELNSSGKLHPQAVEHSLAALRRMKAIAAGFQVNEMRVIATCAVREATDGPEFCRRVKEELDLDVEVISSQLEGQLAFLSVSRAFNLHGQNVAVADIGGGSTEIILASGAVIEAILPTPLGAVRVTERFNASEEMNADAFKQMLRGIDRKLRRSTKKFEGKDSLLEPHLLIGSGGTFTTLGEMIMASKGQVRLPLRGYEVTHSEVRHLLERLRKMTPKARRAVQGLSADRADIIVGGVAVIDSLLRHFQLNRLQIHDRGVRDGLLLTMMEKHLPATSEGAISRDSAIDRFAAGCGVELRHSRQVARLAGRLFEQLAPALQLSPEDRPLLEAAARLQDVGYLINYEEHHKHSYHLILNSRLAGFQPHELELIANIARYHRGAMPKRKHEHFMQLSLDNQLRVRRLAAILRLAGGLDRSHTQVVQDVLVTANGDGFQVDVLAEEHPEVDLWGARRRMEVFESVFGRPISFDWREAPTVDPRHNGSTTSTERVALKPR